MKKTGIMTDSHSGILENEASKLGIAVLPMPFYIDEKLYREGVDISREEFYEMLRKGADVATSQPSPESVMHMWSAMLQEYEELVYIPISSGLSGSCMTAQAMAQEEPYAGRVFVVDNGRVSTPMHRSVLDAVELAEKGYRAQKIKDILEKNRQHMVIYVGLSTLTYLKKGGRISSVAAVAADVLKIKPVMKFGVGKLDVYQKCRGMKNASKEGQNARLAARLTGFKIDIKSETQARESGDFLDYENDYEDDEYDDNYEYDEEGYYKDPDATEEIPTEAEASTEEAPVEETSADETSFEE